MDYGRLLLAHAVHYVDKFGFSVIPMSPEKKPLIKWAEYQDRLPTFEELTSWRYDNLAIVTGAVSGIVVIDCESREDSEWFYNNRGKSPVIVQTKRGFHFYFRHPGQRVSNGVKIEKRYDVRGDGGYVMAPPSRHSNGNYRWHKPLISSDLLPVFNPEWRPDTTHVIGEKEYKNVLAYIETIHAVEGSGGSNATYRAVCHLRNAGLSEAEAMCAIQKWNQTNAKPPWSERELIHKIRSVYSDNGAVTT